MLKIIFIILVDISLFANPSVSCPGEVENPASSYNYFLPDADAVIDVPKYFIDDKSVVCGGDDTTVNVYYNPGYDDGDVPDNLGEVGVDDKSLLVIKKDGKFVNNVILVDNIPCMPYRADQIYNSYVKDMDSGDIKYDVPYSYTFGDDEDVVLDESYNISDDDAEAYKYLCKEKPASDTSNIDYTPQLNSIIENTNPIKTINDREEKLSDDLDNLIDNYNSNTTFSSSPKVYEYGTSYFISPLSISFT